MIDCYFDCYLVHFSVLVLFIIHSLRPQILKNGWAIGAYHTRMNKKIFCDYTDYSGLNTKRITKYNL